MIAGAVYYGTPWERMLRHSVEQNELRRIAHRTIISEAIIRERAIREALGRWVSELEPVLIYNTYGQFLGLGVAGGGVSVRIKGNTPI